MKANSTIHGSSSDAPRQCAWGGAQRVALSCCCDSSWLVATTLDAINSGAKAQSVKLVATADGLDFSVVDSCRVLQASARLRADLFPKFACAWSNGCTGAAASPGAVHEDPNADDMFDGSDDSAPQARIAMEFHLPMLLRCLNIFGAQALRSTSLALDATSADQDLRLVLECGGVVTECALSALAVSPKSEAPKDFASEFREHLPVRAKAIVEAKYLYNALIELSGHPGASSVAFTLAGTLDDGFLRLATDGSVGKLCINIPATSDAFVELEVMRESDGDGKKTVAPSQSSSGAAQLPCVTQCYQLKLLQHAFRVLASASKTYLRINDAGMLCVQHMVNVPPSEANGRRFSHAKTNGGGGAVDDESIFVDFVLYPDEDLDVARAPSPSPPPCPAERATARGEAGKAPLSSQRTVTQTRMRANPRSRSAGEEKNCEMPLDAAIAAAEEVEKYAATRSDKRGGRRRSEPAAKRWRAMPTEKRPRDSHPTLPNTTPGAGTSATEAADMEGGSSSDEEAGNIALAASRQRRARRARRMSHSTTVPREEDGGSTSAPRSSAFEISSDGHGGDGSGSVDRADNSAG
jgi:hypothetical protein